MTTLNVKKELFSKHSVSKPSKEKEPLKSVATVRKSIDAEVVFD
jgi:hypothetical protein